MFPPLSFVESLISLSSKLRPLGFKQWFFSFMLGYGLQFSRAVKIVKQVWLDVSLVRGVDKKSGEEICVVFIGNEEFPLFLVDLVFSEEPNVVKVGKEFIWRMHKRIGLVADDVDAVLVSCDRFYHKFLHKAQLFVFPHMVDMVLDTSKPLEYLIHKKHISYSAYSDIKKITKCNYSLEITSEIEKIKMFYYSMYLPMIHSRHEDKLLYTPPFVFFKFLREIGYELMLVKDNETIISGIFFNRRIDEMFVRYAGILDGELALIKKGASAAHYYYAILLAKKNMVKMMNFGAVRSFFDDGVFQYKRKWGMKVIKADGSLNPGVFGVYISPTSMALKQFFINNPLIGVDHNYEHIGCFFFENKHQINSEIKDSIKNEFSVPGVSSFRFISFDNFR